MKLLTTLLAVLAAITFQAQQVMTPELLMSLNRVSPIGLSDDGNNLLYRVTKKNVKDNSSSSKTFVMPVAGGKSEEITDVTQYIKDRMISPDGTMQLVTQYVKIDNIFAQDLYRDVPDAEVHVYDDLNYRHWDHWEDGSYSHVMIQYLGQRRQNLDLMQGEPYDCPQQPFGGDEDYLWSPDGKQVLYVTKKSKGKDYAVSTNTDIYSYDIESKETMNLTKDNLGYDTQPAFSSTGVLGWLRMKRDGYESDKNDIIVRKGSEDVNLTKDWDGTVNSFQWSKDGKLIYFVAPINGTVQLFSVDLIKKKIRQITDGQYDVYTVVGDVGKEVIVGRRDMNHAPELFAASKKDGSMRQLTTANQRLFETLKMGKIEKRMVKTTDGKEMLTWVIYPPDFDPNKKYPTLLYCQGGPQGALSQFYSYRWNFQLMAANGYIIVAPNRRGMPGYGVEWNEQISGDYGGQNMEDYLAAIDDVAKEPYVDKDRLGCIGASYGGYSVFYLASKHEGRFKTFISHDGIFNWRSMYGTTEEMFFVNWDLGGAYWDKDNKVAQKTYSEFNPINFVDQWDTPILIIQGGLDFRVPIGQALEAFNAAQLQGIKSRLLYFPTENHWVLSSQNSLVWQREFYKWLKETL